MPIVLALVLAMLPATPSLTAQAAEPLEAPVAAKKPKVLTKFGDRRVDDYFWLREKASPEVIDYLNAENRYAEAVMKPLEAFREKLYKEMLARIKETDESVPYFKNGYWYYQREVEGLQYPIYARRKASMEAPEELLLDVNELAKGRKFTQLGAMDVSPDGTKLAYTVDFTGFRQYTLQVKDLASGRLLRDTVERVTSLAWAADNSTLFHVEEDETTKRSYRLHRRVLEGASEVIYEERDEQFDIGVAETRSESFVVLSSVSKDTSEVRVLRSNDPRGEFRVVEKRRKGLEYYVDHRENEFFIRTNDKGANFRLVRAPVDDPSAKRWRQVVAHRPLVMLEEVDLFKDFWVLVERDKGLLRLRINDFASGEAHYIDFDEAVYAAHPSVNAEFDTKRFRFVYESLVTP
nr:oligopeptidase B [Pseudomonadota bacterium]